MKMNEILSIILVVVIIFSMTPFVYADEPVYEPEIIGANISDYYGEIGNEPYDTYSAAEADGVITITMENLKKHGKEGGTQGYWTGFSIKAPVGATKFNCIWGDDTYTNETVEVIDGVSMAQFFTDALTPKSALTLQWYDEVGEAVTEEVAFTIEYDIDLLYPVDNYEPEIIKANVKDYDTDNAACESYVVSEADGEITVTMENLAKHTKGNGQEGYWTGFAVKAPTGAEKFTCTWGDTVITVPETVETLYLNDENIGTGVSFYTDALNPKDELTIQWFNNAGEFVTEEVTFNVVYDVTYDGAYDITTEDVIKANIGDFFDSDAVVYSSYNVDKVEEDNKIKVTITSANLKPHKNGLGDEAYWTGFAVKAPANATKFNCTLGDATYTNQGVEGLYLDDEYIGKGVSFYIDIDDAIAVATLQFFDNNNDPISNVSTFEIDLTGVAKYQVPSYTPTGGGGGSVLNNLFVSFNTNGGSKVDSIKVKKNEVVSEPATPTKNGFEFDGWYTDKNLTNKYDFSSQVTKSFTLYAKWLAINPEIDKSEDSALAGKEFFDDVKETDWFSAAVKFVYEKGIAKGVSDTEYAPQSTVTRGQFITMLCRAYGIEEMTGDNFADAGNAWYTGYLAAAKQLGISTGVGDNNFAPEKEITREEMVTLIYNYLKSIGKVTEETTELTFVDSDSVSDWAKPAVAYAAKNGIVNGKENNMFDPQGTATRAELAQIFYNMFK